MNTTIYVTRTAILLLAVSCVTPCWAQSDAEIALNKARAAFDASDFESSRDLLVAASQTAPNNPDIFLLLGKSHYHLGEIEPAIKAWRTTIKLAPQQAYAKGMLAALAGQTLDTNTRLDIVERLLKDRLLEPINQQLTEIRRDKRLTDAQLRRLLQFEAEYNLSKGSAQHALLHLNELSIRFPDEKAEPAILLLTARAHVAIGGDLLKDGLQQLKELAKDNAENDIGASAELELLAFNLSQGAEKTEALLAWIKAHPDHAALGRSHEILTSEVTRLLNIAAESPTPKADGALHPEVKNAIAAIAAAAPSFPNANDSARLIALVINHLNSRYAANEAFDAASTGMTELAKINVAPTAKRQLSIASRALATQIATAEYEKIAVQLGQNIDETPALIQWIKSHPNAPQLNQARQVLLTFYLNASLRERSPEKNSPLSPHDVKAIALASDIYAIAKSVNEAKQLTDKLSTHLEKRYAAAGALQAAQTGYNQLLKLKTPITSQVSLLHGLAGVQSRLALSQLRAEADANRIVAGPLPASLQAVLATYAKITTLTPAQPASKLQAELAQNVSAIASNIPWDVSPTAPKPPQAWALEIALPVISDSSDNVAVTNATAVATQIIDDLATLPQQSADTLAVDAQAKLIAALPAGDDRWSAAMLRQADLLTSLSVRRFQRNVDQGKADANAALSASQKQLIETLKKLVAEKPSQTTVAIQKLQSALKVMIAAQHYDAAREAYATLGGALPAKMQFDVRLAAIRLNLQQVMKRDAQAIQTGYAVAEKLDPLMESAILEAHELQRNLKPTDSRLKLARAILDDVAAYYSRLEMYAVVEAAIKVKPEKPVPAATVYSEFKLAGHLLNTALREQSRILKTFEGRQSLTFTPAFIAAEKAYQKFVTDHIDDALASQAIDQLFSIGKRFEQYEHGVIAAQYYGRLEKFAAGVPKLTKAPSGEVATVERAALAAALALHNEANRSLTETLAKQPADAAPPAKLSDEFAKAIAAYQAIIKNYPDGPLVKVSIHRTLSIAAAYAHHDAWEVANGVYVSLGEQKLPLRNPEELEFARAICELGKVMPEHAKQILAAFTQTGRSPGSATSGEMLVQLNLDGQLEATDNLYAFDRPNEEGEQHRPGQSTIAGNIELPANEPQPTVDPAPADPFGDVQQPNGPGAGGIGNNVQLGPPGEEAQRQMQLLAAIQNQQGNQASQIARLRDAAIQFTMQGQQSEVMQEQTIAAAILSPAELARRQQILNETYSQLQAIRTRYPHTTTAAQAREEIMVIINHWRELSKWDRAAKLAAQFLKDNPRDAQLPSIRQEIARDYLAWASQVVSKNGSKQEILDIVNSRFETARNELAGIVAEFTENAAVRHQAQWDIANSYLTQARVIAQLSPTLARGQYVRSANEIVNVAETYHDHPRINDVPQMLWNIAQELSSAHFYDEAISVWNILANNYPLNSLGEQASLQIAQTYQTQGQPLQAVEAFVELHFSRGGQDSVMQDRVYNLASQLMSQKRWVEALHALETFIDAFPEHAQAGQALTMIGQIHQTNEVWEDAIAAYDRVLTEYPSCPWVKQARWSIAECKINLSRWSDAIDDYQQFAAAYGEDPQVATAKQRIEILKDLNRYQKVVDEEGQRKAFDAQYQIAVITRGKLNNSVKSIIEFRKVVDNWPESHLADDALYQIGVTYLDLRETEKSREALLAAAEKYPTSPLADDALLKVGESFEQQATSFAAVTRDTSVAAGNEEAQKLAYFRSQGNRRSNRMRGEDLVSQLKDAGKYAQADELVARNAANFKQFDLANAQVVANWAGQQAEVFTAAQLADRQDKVNAALRHAVASYRKASALVTGDKADDALLRMAKIYDGQLKDPDAAMETWQEIVKQFSGTSVAEDASWKIAQYHEDHGDYQQAIDAYQAFLRNYRSSGRGGQAQSAIAENYEHLGEWVAAMDAYTNYLNNFPQGPLAAKAKEQISWIKTYRL